MENPISPNKNYDKYSEYSINMESRHMIRKAYDEEINTVWDRLRAQEPQCGYCSLGLSCRNCAMGPCRIDPFNTTGPQTGVCGADGDVIVARNLARAIAAGAAAHSDHGRDILEVLFHIGCNKTKEYTIHDTAKLYSLAREFGIKSEENKPQEVAKKLAWEMMEEFGTRKNSLTFINRAPEHRKVLWEKLGITPRGIDRENIEALHRTHMGVDNDYINILLHGLRTSLSDGWGGSLIATELSDVLFGTPKPVESKVNLGVIRPEYVNIALHGHNPLLSDAVVQAAEDPDLKNMAIQNGAKGINLIGLCCTGNELLMRRGVPMAGNHLMQELAIMTGVLEAVVVDYQCIMPAITDIAKCYHTKIISTSDKAKFTGASHIDFNPKKGIETGKEIVTVSIKNFSKRIPQRMYIPSEPVSMMAGFSAESIIAALGGTPEPLVNAIKGGKIRGVAGIVGCNNPKIRQDYGHITLTKMLIENDILVAVTGCAAIADGKAGLLMPDAAESAGPGLREICRSLSIPPVLHMGSCVDNTRIVTLASTLAKYIGVDISMLPLAGAAPEWYSEKAISIGAYVVASGIFTVLGVQPAIFGSPNVVKLLTEGLEDVVGATFAVEPDPKRSAVLIRRHIEKKRKALDLPALDIAGIDMPVNNSK